MAAELPVGLPGKLHTPSHSHLESISQLGPGTVLLVEGIRAGACIVLQPSDDPPNQQ